MNVSQLVSSIIAVLFFIVFLIAGSVRVYWSETDAPAFEVALTFQWPTDPKVERQLETTAASASVVKDADDEAIQDLRPRDSVITHFWKAILVSYGAPQEASLLDKLARGPQSSREEEFPYRITVSSAGRRLQELIVIGPYLPQQAFHASDHTYQAYLSTVESPTPALESP